MGCSSLSVWAIIAAAYTTVESFCFLALNTLLILIHADVYNVSTGFFASISLYTVPDDPTNNCTASEGVVSTRSVVAYQYTFIVFHVLWIISGLVILSQLCRKTRSLADYVMWLAVAVILILLDTVTGIFFIVDRAGMAPENNDCLKAAFSMILISFRWFILFIVNIACVVVVALAMRQHKAKNGKPKNNYMDPPPTRKGLQSDNQGIDPPEARPGKPPAALPTETIEEDDENKFISEQMQTESEIPNPFDPGDQEGPTDNTPETSFQTHSPTQVHHGDFLEPMTHNWQEIPLDQHRYPMSAPQTSAEHNYLSAQNSLSSRNDGPMSQGEQYPFSYTPAGRPGHGPRRSIAHDEQQRLERFGLHSERHGDFARSQFDDEQRHMPPVQSQHAYDNQAWTNDTPYEEDNFPHEAPGPQGGHRPPPRTKRNGPNRHKRAAPQPKETPTDDSIEEEEEEIAPIPPKVASLAPTASFDPRPFSYLNPTFRPTDHADVKAMKSHTADIVKTLDQETKQLKEKEKLSEDSDAKGVISSTLVRNYLNDSGRRKDVKRSTSLRDQLARSGKAAAGQQSANRPNAHRDLGPIEESNSSVPVPAARPRRRHTGDSARPGRTAVDRDGHRRSYGDDTQRLQGGDRDRGAQRRPHNDREENRKHAKRDQTDDVNKDDYDSSDYDEEEDNHKKPVFITSV